MRKNYCESRFFKSVLFVYRCISYLVFAAHRKANVAGIPEGVVWIHAASIGEVQVAVALISFAMEEYETRNERAPDFMLSVNRSVALHLAKQLLPEHFEKIFVLKNPFDNIYKIRAILNTVRPRAYITVEKEIWPLLLSELGRRKIPAFLMNARLRKKSASRRSRNNLFWKGTLSLFRRILVRFEEDRRNFISLEVPGEKLVVTGNCKIDIMCRRQECLTGRYSFIRDLSDAILIAGSVHGYDAAVVFDAWAEVRKSIPHARLIVAPRHTGRKLKRWKTLAARYGKIALFSEVRCDKNQNWDIVLVDTTGDLLELYGHADAAFIGGSMPGKNPYKKRKGQNLMEPILFGKPVAHGPEMEDFPETVELDDRGLAVAVRDVGELAAVWRNALNQAPSSLLESAGDFFRGAKGGTARSWRIMEKHLFPEADFALPGTRQRRDACRAKSPWFAFSTPQPRENTASPHEYPSHVAGGRFCISLQNVRSP